MRQKTRATVWAAQTLILCMLAVPVGAAEPKGKMPATAPAASASEEPADLLRQRLAERLGNKGEAVGGPPLKVVGKGRGEEAAKPAPRGTPKMAMETKTSLPVARVPSVPWGYAGDGSPEHWAELSAENRQCGIGTRQSPIDIRDGIKVELEKIQFDYRPSSFSVIDTGRTVQVNVAPGNGLQVMGRRYELVQFHFHRPSEERINGRQYDMVAHLVHKSAEGHLAEVAVLLERGRDQALVQTVWNNLPLEKGEALAAPGLLDLSQLLPEDRAYYTYMGSQTTPPCAEGVLWMVMRQPVQLSAGQISIFSRLYPMNARPIQAGAGRLIKESN